MDEKTKQVLFRLTPELHDQLKGNLALNGRKLVDFFNDAAAAYIMDAKKYDKTVEQIIQRKEH